MYRKTLYFLFFTTLAFLFLQGVGGKSPITIGRYLLAQVGMHASTLPNQYNTLAQQLLEKQQSLDEKEKELSEQEAALKDMTVDRERRMLLLLSLTAGILLLLILLNYYFDHRARKNAKIAAGANPTGKAGEVFKIY